MLYVKALHIIFIVTWFAGLFYQVRLMVYLREAQDKPTLEKEILTTQLLLMSRKLLYGITWPSAVLTLIMGLSLWAHYPYTPTWLWVKLVFVLLLYLYHFSVHRLYLQQRKGIFRMTSRQLRIHNEGPTVVLFAVVFLAVTKSLFGLWYGLLLMLALIGIALLVVLATQRSPNDR